MKPAERRQSQVGPREFLFLNRQQNIETGWDNEKQDKLWRYNLHYFDDLNSEQSESRKAWHSELIQRWIFENPPGIGTAWEPYPTSIRIVNWIKWALAGNELSANALDSLAIQVRWLSSRLEHHLLGNHLLTNAKALAYAGLFFDDEDARAWLDKATSLLDRELDEQILGDGGHFELSTMYHALVFEDVLDLINLARTYPAVGKRAWRKLAADFRECARRMNEWLLTMCHPDGEISFFNDAAIGVAPPTKSLCMYAQRLGFATPSAARGPVTVLGDSGYIRAEVGAAVALIDVAEVGPDYLPGHGHADTLSFELSIHGFRTIVNSGTGLYGTSPERLRQRGTSAHNTVVLDNKNSSEVWSGFRVARRAKPSAPVVVEQGWVGISCSHNGYSRLEGHPIHNRSWRLLRTGLLVTDHIEGTNRDAEARTHFHPLVKARMLDSGAGELLLPNGCLVHWQIEKGSGCLESTHYYPEFGLAQKNQCLVVSLRNGMSVVHFTWPE